MRLLKQLWIVIGALVGAFVLSWLYYMPDADQRGVWRAETGGAIITLNRFTASMYSETSTSCVRQLTFPAHLKLVELAEGAKVIANGDRMNLVIDGAIDPIPFVRIDAFPDTCGEPDPNASAHDVFMALWTAMNDHYAFFDLHGVDWQARLDRAPAPDATLTDEALFELLSETLVGLDDGHVQLVSPLGYFSPSEPPAWLPAGTPLDREALWQIARDTVGADLTPIELTGIEYTLLPNGIGYLMIRHMGLQTPFGARSEPAMMVAFEEVADAMANARALIIDVRYNPGGSDSVAFGIGGHFIDAPREVLTKTTRDGDGQTEPFTAIMYPFDESPLTQPIVLLTSPLTGSAAEIFTLALRDLPNVTTMGEATGGGLSDILGFRLPNGWDFGLSHQTYAAMDGAVYEGAGIPPAVPFAIEEAPLLAGQDPLLRAAFDSLREN